MEKVNWTNVLGGVGSVASIIGLIITIVVDNEYVRMGTLIFFLLYIIGLTVFIIIRYFSLKRIKNNLIDAQQKNMDSKLRKLSESNRHIYSYLKNETADINNSSNVDPNNYKNVIIKCCDALNNYFKEYLEVDTSVCIKMIKTDTILDDNVLEWDIETLGRCTSSKFERCVDDHVPCKVHENSDFETILSGKENYFASPNLNETIENFKQRKEKFKNSRENFLDFYKSAIVTPISINMKKISNNLQPYSNPEMKETQLSYHVLGFLCIDSMETFDLNSNKFFNAVEQARAFSDALYPLMEAYLITQIKSIA